MDTPARHLQTCLASIKGLVIVVVGVCGCELKSYSQCVNKQPWVIIKARHWKAWNYGYVCRVIVTVVPKHRKGARQTQDWVSQGRRWPEWWLNSRPHNRSRRWCHVAGGKKSRTRLSVILRSWQLGYGPGRHRRLPHRRSSTVWGWRRSGLFRIYKHINRIYS